jgi:hypothetical protein
MQEGAHPLSFKSVKGRMRLVDANYVAYADGTGFFVSANPNIPQPFPFAPSARCFVGKHPDEEIIPASVISNWLDRLSMTFEQISMFWAIVDLGPAADAKPISTNT